MDKFGRCWPPLAVCLLAGCSLIASKDDFSFGTNDGGVTDQGDGAVADAGDGVDAGPGSCVGARPPGRVSTPDSAGSERYVVVLRDVVLDQREADGEPASTAPWRSIGYNLDGLCTTADEPSVECAPTSAGLPVQLDGHDGIDNTFGNSFFPVLSLGSVDLDEEVRANQQRGVGAVVMLIEDWDGGLNDSRVTVTLTQSVFGTRSDGDGGAPNVNVVGSEPFLADGVTPAPPPVWDGSDYFWARADTFIANDLETPNVRVTTAYITDGVLVARLPDRTPLRLLGESVGIELTLTDLIFTGNVHQLFFDPLSERPAMMVTGRWGYNDMVSQGPHIGICVGTPLYTTFQRILDGMLDVLQDPPAERMPSLPCDALSTAVRFDAYAGNLGGLAAGQTIASPCP